MKHISRGRGWYGKALYEIPEGLTYSDIILMIVAYRGGIEGEVPLQDIVKDFEMYVAHDRAYQMCTSAIRKLRGSRLKRASKGKYSYYSIMKGGWVRLNWLVKNGRKLPEPYGDVVKEMIKEAVEYYGIESD